ncbi:MAG: hypothetical protein GEV12_19500 [Micromonosporaceae bacterium]|nr:hypothetical protein [Micromonosporaceae bacterium]
MIFAPVRPGADPRWWLVRRASAVAPYLVLAAVTAVTVAGLVARPDTTGTAPVAEQVILAGAVGLRWDDLDPQRTPQLWRLAGSGAIGSLSARSAHQPTCPLDGWLTLGAGNWAAAPRDEPESGSGGDDPRSGQCPPMDVTIGQTEGTGARLPDHDDVVDHNQDQLPWGAVPGALAGSVDCTVAVGVGGVVAAARSSGRVDRYRAALPNRVEDAARLLDGRCELAVVDLGTIAGEGAERAAGVRRVDAALGRVLAARPPDSLVLAFGVADADAETHLQVAVADAAGLPSGWLTSPTTGRTGYLQLVDLAPTALAAIDRPAPQVELAGQPAYSLPRRSAALADAVAELAASDHEAVLARPVAGWFLAGLTVAQLVLFAAVVPLLRRPGPLAAGPSGRATRRWRSAGQMLLVVVALAIPAALVADGVPWWRSEAAGGVFAVTSLAVLAAASVLVARTPIFRRTLALVGAGAGVAAAAVAVDLLTGSWLQLNGVVGYSAHDGGRYAGLSEIGLGVLIAGTLLVAGCLADPLPRRQRPLVVAAVGALGVVLAGSPYLGADIGGAVALLAGVCVAAALSSGGWLTYPRVGLAVLAGVVAVGTAAAFDLRRPVEQRTGLGTLLTQLSDGTAGSGLEQVSIANADAFTANPLTVLAIGAGVFIWFALLRPWGGLRRLFAIHPALRGGMVGGVVAALLGGVLVGTALVPAGAAAAVGVPLLTLAALRLRRGSALRVDRQQMPGRVPADRTQ